MFIDTEFLKNSEIKLVLEGTAEGNEEKGWVPAYHFAICMIIPHDSFHESQIWIPTIRGNRTTYTHISSTFQVAMLLL